MTGAAPFFAPAALSDDTAYVADLDSVVHALNLKNGVARWKLDVSTETGTPGMVYAGPVLDAGRLYVVGDSETPWGTPRREHTGTHDAFAVRFEEP